MSDTTFPEATAELAPPPASLLDVSIRPRRGAAPAKTRGDLTARLAETEQAASETPGLPARESPLPAAAQPPGDAAGAPRERRRAEDLLAYWEVLAQGRRVAPLDRLDRAMVARGWADSLLLAVGSAPGPTITRLGEPSGNIEYTAMVAEWLMSQARRAAQRGERVDTAESFAQSAGTTRCRLLAFPLTGPSGAVEQVLCHVCLAEDGARPERRGWFSA